MDHQKARGPFRIKQAPCKCPQKQKAREIPGLFVFRTEASAQKRTKLSQGRMRAAKRLERLVAKRLLQQAHLLGNRIVARRSRNSRIVLIRFAAQSHRAVENHNTVV